MRKTTGYRWLQTTDGNTPVTHLKTRVEQTAQQGVANLLYHLCSSFLGVMFRH